MIGIGIIGYGYWGPNLVRNFAECPGAAVLAVCDRQAQRLARVKTRYPGVSLYEDYRELLRHPGVDAVVVATPVRAHFELAMAALKAGKHVLVEKPMASSSEECTKLIGEAEARNRILMVDHTFVYTGAVRAMRSLVESGALGDVYYYDSVRVNLGLFQRDVSVVWDLAVHDLSVLDYVIGARPTAVSATGISHVSSEPANLAYITIFFNSNLIAHLNVNWLAPVKVRRTLIGGSKKMIVYDDLEPSEKVKVYDKGVIMNEDPNGIYQMLIGYRSGDMWAPHIAPTEALQLEASHFIECIERGARPLTDGRSGRAVVRILEAATHSLGRNGEPVSLSGAQD